ncbi:hypothetical protein GHT89_16615 [Acinetobacter baumannii]|uniref:hypothetical protein n=1 Tax=Acinetobacter baumannii TaxID=470 RepID=UPI00387DC8B4
MSDIKKHQSDDLIYVFGQIPVHIMMILVFGIILFNNNNFFSTALPPFNWLVIALCSMLLFFDFTNIVRAFTNMFKMKKSFWTYINDNLYKSKSKESFMSLDNMTTFGMGLALFGFLILPDATFFDNYPFAYIFFVLVWIGLIFALASLLISFKVHYSKG